VADEILELAEEAIRRVEDGDPSDGLGLAERAVALATDDASFVNGTHVLADGGIMARLFDLY